MCAPHAKVVEDFDRIREVSSKRSEWASTSVAEKLATLEEIESIISKEIKYEEYEAVGEKGAKMKGFDVNTVEGKFAVTDEVFLFCFVVKKQLNDMIRAYKVRAGLIEPPKKLTKGNFETKKAINGQVVTKTFPLWQEDIKGFFGHMKSEVWMDSSKIQDESQVEAFSFDKAWEDSAGKEGGLMVVLGAGNQIFLSFVDILYAMFTRNYVVYFKQHPIRNYWNDLYERMFAPLISRGYLAIEAHSTNERSSALVYHPEVDAFHMTGGKATHDLLVWGADPKEREQNLKANTPKLNNVTSELGAITPWVIVPGKYTKAEMKSQADILVAFVHNNASCNCNAPKCVVVAEDWDQKEEFLQVIENTLAKHRLPVPFYPGTEKRWKKFCEEYPSCPKIGSDTDVVARKLSAAVSNEKPILLPFLKIPIEVDLETASGKEAASKEFAFNNEPFAPVLTFATLRGTSQNDVKKFSETASVFCNDYLFGTLSGTITAPPSMVDGDGVQTLIAQMKYGCLCVNNWSGFGYMLGDGGMWGAFPGESIKTIESGIGKIGNTIAIPHVEKAVVYSPIVHATHASLKEDLKKERTVLEATCKYTLNSSAGNLIKLIGAMVGIDLMKVGLVFTGALVAGCAYLFRRK